MFDQESYSFEVPAEPLREGDMFYHYEVGTWKLDRRLYSILGISLLLNLTFFGVMAQTNVLMARGCDSPFVGRVCQVLDLAYVGTVLFGTEREYVDAEYDRTDLGEAEVTWIDQTGVPPQFEYPEGYFYQETPPRDQIAMNPSDGFIAPGIPSVSPVQSGNSLIDTPAIAPKQNKNAVVGDIPDSPFDLSDTNTASAKTPGKKGKGNSNSEKSDPEKNVAQTNSNTGNPAVDPTKPVDPNEINKRPFKDLGNLVNEKVAKNEVDLQSEFSINARGKLNKEGKFDPKSFKYIAASSPDPDMIDVVKRGIEAINESGYLKYLSDLSGKDLDLQVKQDLANLNAVVQTELESENRARTLSSLLGSLISMKMKEKQAVDADENDKDDLILLENAKVEQIGKKLIITFNVPKEVVHKMIERKLAEQAAESKKPSGNAMTNRTDNTAAK